MIWLVGAAAVCIVGGASALKVAVIGGGISGASVSHFLKENRADGTIRPPVEIHLFERNGKLGGRTALRLLDEKFPVEEGAGVVHDSNQYFLHFAKLLNLTASAPEAGGEPSKVSVAMWDGDSMIWQMGKEPKARGGTTSQSVYSAIANVCRSLKEKLGFFPSLQSALGKWHDCWPLMERYGMYPWWRVPQIVRSVIRKWEVVYTAAGMGPYESLEQMVNALGLRELALSPGDEYFKRADNIMPWRLDSFLLEVSSSFNRVNYGQDHRINAFASSVSLAGVSMVGRILRVEGGNHQVAEGMIKRSVDKLLLGHNVMGVERVPSSNLLRVHFNISSSDEVRSGSEDFDAVIFGTNVMLAELDWLPLEEALPAVTFDPFVTTTCTWVISDGLNPGYFGVESNTGPYEVYDASLVMTPEYAQHAKHAHHLPFRSIGLQKKMRDGRMIHKIFSENDISTETIAKLFVNATHVERKAWDAYPIYKVDEDAKWPSFRIASQVYYVNALEKLVSTLETQAVAGRNVAELFWKDYDDKTFGDSKAAELEDAPVAVGGKPISVEL